MRTKGTPIFISKTQHVIYHFSIYVKLNSLEIKPPETIFGFSETTEIKFSLLFFLGGGKGGGGSGEQFNFLMQFLEIFAKKNQA